MSNEITCKVFIFRRNQASNFTRRHEPLNPIWKSTSKRRIGLLGRPRWRRLRRRHPIPRRLGCPPVGSLGAWAHLLASLASISRFLVRYQIDLSPQRSLNEMTIINEMPLKGLRTSQTLRAVLRVKREQRAVYSVFVLLILFFFCQTLFFKINPSNQYQKLCYSTATFPSWLALHYLSSLK